MPILATGKRTTQRLPLHTYDAVLTAIAMHYAVDDPSPNGPEGRSAYDILREMIENLHGADRLKEEFQWDDSDDQLDDPE